MPVIHALAERLRSLENASTEAISADLEAFERTLIELGARPDPELLEAVEAVEGVFPRAQLLRIQRSDVQPKNPAFPPCPKCATGRYWIAPTGKVVCGFCGQVRFVLTSIQYRKI